MMRTSTVNVFGAPLTKTRTASRAVAVRAEAEDLSEFYGRDRRTWLPDYDPPAWLDGTMAGDHGYDPFGIMEDPRTRDQFRRGEVINSRFCMLGVVGMLVPEILASGGNTDIKGAVWFESGAAMLNGGKLNYFGVEIPFTLQFVIITNAAALFFAEWFRWQEFAPGYEPDCADTLYPGGPFDPLGLAEGDDFDKLKINEIRNGRLSKIAFLGMIWQAYITREGPWKNWEDFCADPGANNIFTKWGQANLSL